MNSGYQAPYVLAIGGFDPSGGAGVLADIKTMESHGVMGLAAITANTLQTEDSFQKVLPIAQETVEAQIALLLQRYRLAAVKIGLVPSLKSLLRYLTLIECQQPAIPIIWDPVLSATAGNRNFWSLEKPLLTQILAKCTLCTPNVPEAEILFDNLSPAQVAEQTHCAVVVKGGHRKADENCVVDTLYTAGAMDEIRISKSSGSKHGTGCVYASSVASQLAIIQADLRPSRDALLQACRQAQQYVAEYIASSPSLLGFHYRNRGQG